MAFPSQRFWKWALPSGAVGSGALAALLGVCCGVPWLVAAIGVSGAIAVARVAFLAPYLWVAAFGVSLGGLLWAYRVEPVCEAACIPAKRRGRRLIAWLILATLVALFVAVRGWQGFSS